MNMFERNGMNSVLRSRKVSLRFGLLAVAAWLLVATAQAPARAAGPVPSLDIVPADAAFYSAMLRNREQYDAIVNSKAFAKIKAIPYVQMGLGMMQAQAGGPGSPLGQFEAARNNPDVKKSLDLLADLLSDEVFVYGGANFNQALELLQGTYSDVYFSSLMEGFQHGFEQARTGKKAPGGGRGPRGSDLRAGTRQPDRSHQVPRSGHRFQGQRQGAGEGATGQARSDAATDHDPGTRRCKTV